MSSCVTSLQLQQLRVVSPVHPIHITRVMQKKSSHRKTGGLRGSIIEIQRVQTLDNDMEAVHCLVYLL